MKQACASFLTFFFLMSAGQIGLRAAERIAFQPTQWVPASNEQLDNTRGGFNLDTGLNVSFGIIRTVTINGNLVSRTNFDLPDITRITADQARLVNKALGETGLIQSGGGNFVDPSIMTNLNGGTIIQNSLNDQQIQTLTVINTGVNSLALLKSINTQGVLTDSLFRSSRGL
jgi:hypothetical protein